MEYLFYAFIALVGFIAVFLVIEHPFKFASLIVFMLLYKFNFETPLPLDARGLLLLLLFVRIIFFDKENMALVTGNLLRNKYFWILFLFTVIIIIDPILNSKSYLRYAKDIVLSLINLSVGFVLVKNDEGRKAIVFGIVLAGIISSVDLVFNFFTTATLNIIRLPDLLLGNQIILNHNYPGFLASMGILYVYLAWYHTKVRKSVLVGVGLFLFLGVILSTSRSALLATIVTIFLMSLIEPDLKHNLRKIVPAGMASVVILVTFFFIYNIFLSNNKSNSFIDTIYYRLYEEPLQMFGTKKSEFNKWTGQRIDGSMQFRAERWQDDFEKFTNLDLSEQLMGLGPKGYLDIALKIYANDNNIYERLAPHNGYLIILLERGIIGLLIFLILFTSLVMTALKVSKENDMIFPFIYLIIMMAVYSFAQNSEITSSTSYLFFGAIIGNIIFSKLIIIEDDEKLSENILPGRAH